MHFTTDLIEDDNVHIGEYTYGYPHIYLGRKKYHVYIGKFCSIADDVKMIIGGEHRTDWITTYPFGCEIDGFQKNPAYYTSKGDIHIGNDVWIGMNATILSGITIGDGAVIGANSVISHDVEDYEIVAGNPARHIRYRFSKDQIEALKRISWWDWPIEKIKEFVPLLESPDIDSFIRVADGNNIYNANYGLSYRVSKKTIEKAI